MSLVDHDSWDIEYEGCERLRHQLMVLLHQRRQLGAGTVSTPEYAKITDNITASRAQLAKDVTHLKVVLDNAAVWETSSEQELQQRRIDYDKLISDIRNIDTTIGNSARESLLASGASSSSSSVWQQMGGATVPPGRPHDVATLRLQQAAILEQQDRGLEALSATISRQRELATQVYDEVGDQHNILDNLANTMDRVEAGVQRETRSLGQVSRRDSTWCYWLVIISLFVANIVVVLL